MDKLDEIVDTLTRMKHDLDNGEQQKDLAKKYKVRATMLSDIQDTVDIDKLREDVEFIEKSLNSGEVLKKIAIQLPYSVELFNYIVRKIKNQDIKEITIDNKKEYAMKVESMWRLYKAGETINVIACKYNFSIEETQYIVKNFDDIVKMARRSYENKKDFNEEIEKRKTQKQIGKYLSEDIMNYILHGKPIDFSNKGNVREEERDEL